MGQTDLEVLLDMGFEEARAKLAVKKTGGCQFAPGRISTSGTRLTPETVQGALNWLEETQDKSLEELQAEGASAVGASAEGSASPSVEGANAKSLVCNECGKKFRNHDAASFHASKT